jgi:hypothetical protein
MKIRQRLRWLRDQWIGIWWVVRYPPTVKAGWHNSLAWTFALAWVGLVLVADLITKDYDIWGILNVALGAGEFVMLHRSIEGLLWRRGVEKLRRGASRTSPGRGSTGE